MPILFVTNPIERQSQTRSLRIIIVYFQLYIDQQQKSIYVVVNVNNVINILQATL